MGIPIQLASTDEDNETTQEIRKSRKYVLQKMEHGNTWEAHEGVHTNLSTLTYNISSHMPFTTDCQSHSGLDSAIIMFSFP